MNVLLTTDDGYQAAGFRALVSYYKKQNVNAKYC